MVHRRDGEWVGGWCSPWDPVRGWSRCRLGMFQGRPQLAARPPARVKARSERTGMDSVLGCCGARPHLHQTSQVADVALEALHAIEAGKGVGKQALRVIGSHVARACMQGRWAGTGKLTGTISV